VLEGRDGWSVMKYCATRASGRRRMRRPPRCATCHVYIDGEWYAKLAPPSEAEVDMLDMALAVEPISRLSCQIVCAPTLDGIKLTIAPE